MRGGTLKIPMDSRSTVLHIQENSYRPAVLVKIAPSIWSLFLIVQHTALLQRIIYWLLNLSI